MPIDPDAARIRTAARHRFCDRRDDVLVRLEIAIVANPASYAAHGVTLSNVRSWLSTAAAPIPGCTRLSFRARRSTSAASRSYVQTPSRLMKATLFWQVSALW